MDIEELLRNRLNKKNVTLTTLGEVLGIDMKATRAAKIQKGRNTIKKVAKLFDYLESHVVEGTPITELIGISYKDNESVTNSIRNTSNSGDNNVNMGSGNINSKNSGADAKQEAFLEIIKIQDPETQKMALQQFKQIYS